MKKWFRAWLGIDDLQARIGYTDHLHYTTHEKLDNLQHALAEPIAKLSAVLSDEHSTARKAASDMIGEEAIKRASAEDKARRHTLGELE